MSNDNKKARIAAGKDGVPVFIPGRKLKMMRIKAKITTSVMAEYMGIKSRKTIENWEAGTSTPGINQFFLFCRFCDVHPYTIVKECMDDYEAQHQS